MGVINSDTSLVGSSLNQPTSVPFAWNQPTSLLEDLADHVDDDEKKMIDDITPSKSQAGSASLDGTPDGQPYGQRVDALRESSLVGLFHASGDNPYENVVFPERNML